MGELIFRKLRFHFVCTGVCGQKERLPRRENQSLVSLAVAGATEGGCMDLPIQLYFYLEWGILKGELPHSGTREAILLRFVFSPLSGVLLVRANACICVALAQPMAVFIVAGDKKS